MTRNFQAVTIQGQFTRWAPSFLSVQQPLEIVSHMPQNGVIFSDGIEEDRLEFNSGTTARISLAERTLRLVVPAA